MTERAQKIWETFKAELIVEPTDDMKQALASSIRELLSLFDNWGGDEYSNEVFLNIRYKPSLGNTD